MSTRKATKADFNVGVTLIDTMAGFEYSIARKYDEGIWETHQGGVVFECEASCYLVKI